MIHKDPDYNSKIECTYCSTILKNGDKYSVDIAGNIKCLDCILVNWRKLNEFVQEQ